MRGRLLSFTLCTALGALTSASADARLLRPSDIARIVNLEQPMISPDGRHIALVAGMTDANRVTSTSELLLVDVASNAISKITVGRGVSDPRWSPDGKRLGYLASDRRDGRFQVFVRDGSGKSAQLTHAAGDVVDFAWRPDGTALAFAAYDAPPTAPSYFEAGDNDYTATALVPSAHLWRVAASGGAARRLTSGSWTIAPTDRGGIFTPQFAWTHDGRGLLFTKVRTTFGGDDEESTLQRLDLRTGRMTKPTPHARFELTPQPSGDGSRLAYWYPRDGDYLSENELHVVDGGRDVDVTRRLDRNVGGSLWLPGSKSLLVCADDGARVRAWIVAMEGRRKLLDLGDRDIVCDSYSSSTFDSGIAASVARNGSIAFLAADARTPRELYYLASPEARPRRLTHFGLWVAKLDLGTMQPFAWDGPEGRASGVITYPPDRTAGRRYPIVLLIHGGPGLASVADFAWEQWPLAQLIASHGYVVFQPNYRGSDSDGNRYMHAIYRDTVAGPSRDILAGLAAVKRLAAADPSRVAVSGWSYGGLLTSWLITQRHDWRAAVSGAAVNDEAGEYDLSTSNVQNRYYFGTSPYAPGGLAFYRSQSPLEFARQITTPTFIWSATGDPVVPVTMSYALFHALKDDRVPVKFVVFPTKTHGPADAAATEALTQLWLAWLDRYLR